MSFFPTIITKEILGKNVVFTSFVGRIVIVVSRSRLDAIECTTLALEEKCDDLVSTIGGDRGLEHDGGLIVLAS
jgi:hypothetical protein